VTIYTRKESTWRASLAAVPRAVYTACVPRTTLRAGSRAASLRATSYLSDCAPLTFACRTLCSLLLPVWRGPHLSSHDAPRLMPLSRIASCRASTYLGMLTTWREVFAYRALRNIRRRLAGAIAISSISRLRARTRCCRLRLRAGCNGSAERAACGLTSAELGLGSARVPVRDCIIMRRLMTSAEEGHNICLNARSSR